MATKEPSLRYTGGTQRRGIKLPTATIRAAERMRMTNPFRNSGAIDRDGNFISGSGGFEIPSNVRIAILKFERNNGRVTDTDVIFGVDGRRSPAFKIKNKWYIAVDNNIYEEPSGREAWNRFARTHGIIR